jgi:hypothetical protein
MERLIVDEHTVEIEDDGAKLGHGRSPGLVTVVVHDVAARQERLSGG